MRSDMGKVLVERPRISARIRKGGPGKGYRKRIGRCLATGETPSPREGMKQRYGAARKSFNEHLGPLRRFLNSNVGRHWNKIYAEICQYVDRGNVVQKHILTHLFEYVITDVVLIDGKPCCGANAGRGRFGESLRVTHRRHQWYVCPKSGLLRRSRYVPFRPKRLELPRMVALNKQQICLFLGGQWELVTVQAIPAAFGGSCFDVILKKIIRSGYLHADPDSMRLYGTNAYAVARRPLSRRELLAMPIPIDWLPR